MGKRIGKFEVSRGLLDRTEEMADIFSIMRFVPYRAEYLAYSDRISYHGVSHLFDEISGAEMMPEYELEICSGDDGRPESVKVRRYD